MAKHPRLQLRVHTYQFRCKVPGDLQEHFGKAEITRSLGTKDHRDALKTVRQESAKQDLEFDKVRAMLAAPIETTISDDEVKRLGLLWLYERMAEDDTLRLEGDGSEALWAATQGRLIDSDAPFEATFTPNQAARRSGMSHRQYVQARETSDIVLPAAKSALARGDISFIEDEMGFFLEGNWIRLAKELEGHRKLALALLRAWVRALEMQKARLDGEAVDTPEPPAAVVSAPVPVVAPAPIDDILFSALWTLFKEQRQLPTKTEADFGTNMRRFIQVNGDLPVKAITKAHVRAFKDAMVRMPVRVVKAQRDLPVPKLLAALANHPDVQRLSPATINEKCLAAVKAVLGYADRNGYRDGNPASGILADVPSHSRLKGPARVAYSAADLTLIFSSPVFSGSERPKGGGGEAAKWLPLLALFSGARLEELGGLRVTDVCKEEGIDFLFIRPDGKGRRLKTRSSRRKVPIHPELIRLGFLDYVQSRRKAGLAQDASLFPDLSSKRTEITAAFSKWWGRYTHEFGLTDATKVFHSFRHGVERGLRNADGVDKTLRDALQGHANSDVAESYGRDEEGQGIALPVLHAALSKLSYPALNLEHLVP